MSDGISHINIYSKGKTLLGRKLSNFSYSPIQTCDGNFNSIEGYWYWLGLESKEEYYKCRLRTLSGYEAKKLGRELGSRDWINSEIFKLKIWAAMLNKLINDEELVKLLIKNQLPFRHYYTYQDSIIEPNDGKWILSLWEFVREELQKNAGV